MDTWCSIVEDWEIKYDAIITKPNDYTSKLEHLNVILHKPKIFMNSRILEFVFSFLWF